MRNHVADRLLELIVADPGSCAVLHLSKIRDRGCRAHVSLCVAEGSRHRRPIRCLQLLRRRRTHEVA